MEATVREADARAAQGDLAGAAGLLQRVVADAPRDVETWIKLASIRRAQGDVAGAKAAVEAALRVDPLHFMALLSRGRLLELSGDQAEAARSYVRALAQLPAGETVPSHLAGIVTHARQVGEAYLARVADNWDAAIGDIADLGEDVRRRLDRFASNALRRTRVYHCEPTHYHYPGLPEREFHDRANFPWLEALEGRTDAIRHEYLALVARGSGRAEPYVQYDAGVPLRQWAELNHSLDWTAFHLVRNGAAVAENAVACPHTMAAIAPVEQPAMAGRGPNAMFSVLKARTRIPPHTGVTNTRLVCHLPLIVPEGCRYRVGAETRPWRIGEAFVFDDTIEHEAINDSDEPRVVLIFDLWHPALSAPERAAVTRMMEAEDEGEGAPL